MAVNTRAELPVGTKQLTFLTQGNQALRNGDYAQAIDLFKKALKQTPALSGVIEFNIALANSRAGFAPTTPPKALAFQALSTVDRSLYALNECSFKVDIVVPVYNALEDLKCCLNAIEKHTDGNEVTTYIVNDASEAPTTEWLREFCQNRPHFVLSENKKNKGYTPTVNVGLRQCSGDYIVTLNSDTIVTKGWINGLIRCFKNDKILGVVGPLSNAASWQTVPKLLDENKQFAVNELPAGWTPDDMAQLVRNASKRYYPKVPFVNGFCFMISREVLNKVGFLDEGTFPTGYGEENDYCIRVAEAGFKLAICDDTYVFHAKSKSFGHEKRKQLSKIGSDALKAKHGKDLVDKLAKEIRDMKIFTDIRTQVEIAIDRAKRKEQNDILSNRILFLLPVSGGGGGVHSIVQETMGMRRLGVYAKIAVPLKHLPKFIKKYNDIPEVEELFLGFETDNIVEVTKNFDTIIGTIYTSMKLVKAITEANPEIQPAYYIQDYEPLFSEPGTEAWHEARNSYTLVPNTILFAKTEWICQKVYEEHGVHVRKVSPSIDHDVYKPDPSARNKEKIVVSAMIRPKTPRRGADRTMRLLKSLYDNLKDKIQIEIFGCEKTDPLFEKLERNFIYNNSGELTRLEVAQILQKSDLFIDLSDYQAFGRTGLEAMACGAASVLPKFGGVYEYGVDSYNCLIVDPFNEEETFKTILDTVNEQQILRKMSRNALMTAANFCIHKAVVSELFNLNEQVT